MRCPKAACRGYPLASVVESCPQCLAARGEDSPVYGDTAMKNCRRNLASQWRKPLLRHGELCRQPVRRVTACSTRGVP